MDANQAAELLAAANNGADGGTPPPAAAAPENNQPTEGAPASQGQPTEGTTGQDSFTDRFDPNTLPPELVPVYRSMQGDYTRKQQEIAAQRQAIEGLDPIEARQALEFVQALNSDPQYALQVHQELTNALRAAGLTEAEAHSAASQAMTQEPDYGESEGSVPPEILKRLEQAEAFMQQSQQQEQARQFEAELTRQEMAIRQANPNWDDADMNAVYAYAYAYGGDLNKAAQVYTDEQARLVTRYLNHKSGVPAGTPAGAGTGQTPPAAFKNTSEATAAAEELFRAAFDN